MEEILKEIDKEIMEHITLMEKALRKGNINEHSRLKGVICGLGLARAKIESKTL